MCLMLLFNPHPYMQGFKGLSETDITQQLDCLDAAELRSALKLKGSGPRSWWHQVFVDGRYGIAARTGRD